MSLGEAARALMAFRFGPAGPDAYRGALLLAAVALGHRPELPEIVICDGSEPSTDLPFGL